MPLEDLSVLKIDKTHIKKRSRKKRWIYILLVAVVITAGTYLYRSGILTPAIDIEIARTVRYFPSEAYTLLNASGYVVAQRKAAVASKITARLISLSVEEGSTVTAGQEIARLENEDVIAARNQALANLEVAGYAIEQAHAELREARLDHQRNRQLLAKEYISQSLHDSGEARYRVAKAALLSAKAGLKAAKAALASAEVNLGYTIIKAPFDAIVLTKNADIGDIVTPLGAAADAKSAVVNIADMDSLMVEVDVSESTIRQVYLKQPCQIMLDALPQNRFDGYVHMIVPTADRSKASIMVKIAFQEKAPGILPEMSARVAFLSQPVDELEKKPVTAIPSTALQRQAQQISVFAVRENRVFKTSVQTGRPLGDMIEITAGLTPGDIVAAQPVERLKDGVRVSFSQ